MSYAIAVAKAAVPWTFPVSYFVVDETRAHFENASAILHIKEFVDIGQRFRHEGNGSSWFLSVL
jgi:hypothetical protein